MARPPLHRFRHVIARVDRAAALSCAPALHGVTTEGSSTPPPSDALTVTGRHSCAQQLAFVGNVVAFRFAAQGVFSRPPPAPVTMYSLGLIVLSEIHSSAGRRRAVLAESQPDPDAEAEQRSPPTERVLRLVDEISDLTLLEVSDLTLLLKKKLGLPDMPKMGMMPMQAMPAGTQDPGAAAAASEAAEPEVVEKTSFDVKLEKFEAASKLKVIKEVRVITGLGLKESKELVEGAPAVLKRGVTKDEAEGIVEKLKAVGAEVLLE